MPYSENARTSARTQNSTPLYVPGQPKPVAFGDIARRLLFKNFDSEKHMVQTPRAIAFDVAVMERATELGLLNIRCTDTRTGNVYATTLDVFRQKGRPLRRGYGNQWMLTVEYWSINSQQPEAERKAEVQAAKAEAASMTQGSLFGGAS